MVAGVDGKAGFEVRGSRSGGGARVEGGGGGDGGEEGVGGEDGGVGDGYGAAGGVVDGHGGEVLKQGSAAPDVEHLGAEADGEDGLAEVVSVLEEELVDVFAGGVGGVALLDGLLAVLLRVDVGSRTGQEDALAVGDELGRGRR